MILLPGLMGFLPLLNVLDRLWLLGLVQNDTVVLSVLEFLLMMLGNYCGLVLRVWGQSLLLLLL